MNTKPAPQLSLEAIMHRNKEEAERLLGENERIKEEMHNILKSVPPPPVSRTMEAFSDGVRATLVPENLRSEPASVKLVAEKEVLYAALAIVRSWKRRKKKNWQSQEKELAAAVERLTWEK
jgi:hypothetical protein